MIINKEGNLFIIRMYKEFINNFDIYDTDNIVEVFKGILVKLKKKYKISGLCDIDVYVNEKYGMIIEVNNIYKYGRDMDVKISFHIDTFFMNEINYYLDDDERYEEIYYYKDKYYAMYEGLSDSNIIYKDSLEIVNKGIRIK